MAIITVLQLRPRESLRMWVNLEFLNGIKGCLEVCVEDGFELLLWNLESALRTSPRAESEALMAEAGKWKGQGVRTKGGIEKMIRSKDLTFCECISDDPGHLNTLAPR